MRILGLLVVSLGILVSSLGVSRAYGEEDCDWCNDACGAADPVFLQRDLRRPDELSWARFLLSEIRGLMETMNTAVLTRD
jgi:hypothetical protein